MPTRGTRALDEVPRPTPEQWSAVKDEIERLYVFDGYGLKEVASTLQQWHPDFTATERMFKSRIKKWNFDLKTIRRIDWQFMFQEYHRRINATTPKETIFEFRWSHRGARDIMKHKSLQHIRQYMRRKRYSDEDFLAEDLHVELFPHIRPRTPPLLPPTPLASPLPRVYALTINTVPLPSFDTVAQTHLPGQSSQDCQSPWRGKSPIQLPTPTSSHGSPQIKQEVNGLEGMAMEMVAPDKFCLSSDSQWHYILGQRTSPQHYVAPGSMEGTCTSLADQHVESEALFARGESNYPQTLPDATTLEDDERAACWWASLYLLASIQQSRNDEAGAEASMINAERYFTCMLESETTCPANRTTRYTPPHKSRFILLGLNLMSTVLLSHDRGDMLELFLERSCGTINQFFQIRDTLGVPYEYLLYLELKRKESLRGKEDDRSKDEFWERRLYGAKVKIRAIWGRDSPNEVMCNYYYAWHVLRQKRHVDAINMLETCFTKAEILFGKNHMVSIKILETIARAWEEQEMYSAAVSRLQEAIRRAQHGLSAAHPVRLQLVERMGMLHEDLDRLRDAEEFFSQVLAGRKRSIGVSHPFTFRAANCLARVQKIQGRHDEAKRLLADMDHEHYIQMRRCYDALGFYAEGQPLMKIGEALEFH